MEGATACIAIKASAVALAGKTSHGPRKRRQQQQQQQQQHRQQQLLLAQQQAEASPEAPERFERIATGPVQVAAAEQAIIATAAAPSHEQSPEGYETLDTPHPTLERAVENARYTSVDSQRTLIQTVARNASSSASGPAPSPPASTAASSSPAAAQPSASHVAVKVAAPPLGQTREIESRELTPVGGGGAGATARNLRHTVPARVLLGAVAELGVADASSPSAAAAAVAAAAQLRMHGTAATYGGRHSVNHTTL